MHPHGRFQRRSFVPTSAVLTGALALVLVAHLTALLGAQARRASWVSAKNAPQPASTLTTMVRAVIGGIYLLGEPATDPAPTAAESILRQLRSVSVEDLVFLAVDQATLSDALQRDAALLSSLRLEPLNIGVTAAPFYLFTQAGTADALRQQSGSPRRILYVDKLGNLQENDVRALLDPLLRTKATAVPLDSPRELARRLLANGGDIVAIYDSDPSTFRSDFVAAYEDMRPRGDSARLQALKLVLFPGSDADYRDRPVGISQTGLTFAIVRYDDLAFNDPTSLVPADVGDRMIALSRTQPAGVAPGGLLLLTNAKGRVSDDEYLRLRRLISYAHIASQYRSSSGPTRCDGASRASYRVFLLNAYLADKRDLVKSLAVWSDLKLALTMAKGLEQSQIQDQIQLVDLMLARQQNFHVANKDDWKNLAARLSAGATVREQFSGQDSTLYRQALDNIRLGLSETGPPSRKRLQTARGQLVELIRKGANPGCIVGGSEGLFNAREFDPFFYLGLIDAHLALESAGQR